MTEQEAFVRRICEDPACDTARLVYADWLEENGKADLAASIRYALWVDKANRLEDTEPEPPRAHHGNGRELLEVMGLVTYMDRGFVCNIRGTLESFHARAKLVFREHPIDHVEILGRCPLVRGAKSYEWLSSQAVRPQQYSIPQTMTRFLKAYRSKGQGNKGRRAHCARLAAHVWWYCYPTIRAAQSDMNAACVRYGRWLVGLPALPEPEGVTA